MKELYGTAVVGRLEHENEVYLRSHFENYYSQIVWHITKRIEGEGRDIELTQPVDIETASKLESEYQKMLEENNAVHNNSQGY